MYMLIFFINTISNIITKFMVILISYFLLNLFTKFHSSLRHLITFMTTFFLLDRIKLKNFVRV